MNNSKLLKVFISYSHKDEKYKDLLIAHLAPLKRRKIIKEWHDRELIPGQEWDKRINKELLDSDLILLLVSADFLASNYCYDFEIKKAIERHNLGEAMILPIILRPCDWKDLPFSKIQGLPKNAKPLSTWTNIDEGFLSVVEGIKSSVQNFKKNKIKEKSKVENKSKEKQSLISEELGLMDYQELSEEYISLSNLALSKISDATSWVGDEISSKANEITALTLNGNEVNRKELKNIFMRTAKVMNNFAKKIEPEIPLFYENFDKAMSSFTGLIEIYKSDFEVDEDEIITAYDSLSSLASSVLESIDSMKGFLDSINGLPRMSKEINQARKNVAIKLEGLIEDLSNCHFKACELKSNLDTNP